MANDALASGQVVVTANADRMVQGLKKADQDVKHWSRGLAGGIGNEIATELGKRGFAGGVLGGIIGGGMGGAVSELVANTLGELGITDLINESVKGTFNWVKGTTDLQAAMARVTDEIAKANTEQVKGLANSAAWRGAMVDWGDQIISIEGDLAKLSARWNDLNNRVIGLQDYMGQNDLFQNEIDANNAMITAWVNQMNKIVDTMNGLQEQKTKLLDPSKNVELAQSIAKSTKALQDQITTWGLVGEEAQRALFKASGANEAMLEAFDRRASELSRLRQSNLAKLPGLGMALGFAGEIGARLANQPPTLKTSANTALTAAVEAGTAQGYSLSVRNRFGGIEGGGDVHKQNGVKLDAIRTAINDGLKKIEDAMRGVGIL